MIDSLEVLQAQIETLRSQFPSIIVMQVNVPGPKMTQPISHLLLRIFSKQLTQKGYEFLKVLNHEIPSLVFPSNAEGLKTKQAMIELENSPLGRFIDCDVYDSNQAKPYSRSEPRRCYLCEKNAFLCRKEQNHSHQELLDFMHSEIKRELTPYLERMIASALQKELDLHPKFGLVTPFTNGSHPDMNYELFRQSIQTITPLLSRFFFLPLDMLSLEETFQKARTWGQEVESAMFQATQGINTHKGSIFHFSLYLLALGSVMSQGLNETKSVFDWMMQWVKPYPDSLQVMHEPYGALAEAKQGYPSLQPLLGLDLDRTTQQLEVLGQLIIRTNDSVLLKRAKTEAEVKRIKHQFESLNWSDPEAIRLLNDECISNGYSFGGAADLFSLLDLHHQSQRLFFD